jgi:NAD(P)-dependent dehydrogenase (short-subunit alcohol dehydrogenase family)
MSETLAGKVAAIIGGGSERDRALALAFAEAGADIALATQEKSQQNEFAMASIANEVWVLGREQFLRLMDASDPVDVTAFADEVCDRMRRVDVLVAAHDAAGAAPLEELSREEWRVALERNLTAPFLAAQAFGRLMERAHGGTIVLIGAAAGGDVAYGSAKAGLAGMAARLAAEWASAGVAVHVVDGALAPAEQARLAVEASGG